MAQTKITGDMIADDAVTTAKIADDAITTALIADDAITTALIADGAITAAKIAAGAIPSGVDIQSSEPSVASEGSLYYNTTTDKLYLSNGTAWLPLDTNAPPTATGGTVTIPTQAGASTFSYNLGLNFTDEDIDANLTYTLESGTLPAGAVLPTAGNTALTGTATSQATATYNFVIRATDAKAAFVTQAYTQVIANTLPTATGGTVTIATQAGFDTFSYNLGLNFSDAQDADAALTYTLASGTLPAGAVLPTSGNTALTGTVGNAGATYNFVIRATDTVGGSVTQAFTQVITVTASSGTGGTVTNISGYKVHTFTSSGTFALNVPTAVQYLVIAGGGAGGRGYQGGGGGAGGYRSNVTGQVSGGGASAEGVLTLPAGNTTVTVGAGGVSTASPVNGNNSVLSSITSIAGGGGGTFTSNAGNSGGSGGGGSNNSHVAPSGTAGQGYAGGKTSAYGGTGMAGGGGGATEVGKDGMTAVNDGRGGDGASSNINGTATTRSGGGGAGTWTGGNPAGGAGGGAAGTAGSGNSASAGSGAANTGGGGGGTGANGVNGGSGGSGIVIIRYAV